MWLAGSVSRDGIEPEQPRLPSVPEGCFQALEGRCWLRIEGGEVTDGVWCVMQTSYGNEILSIHVDELTAMRTMNDQGYGYVRFLKWDEDVPSQTR